VTPLRTERDTPMSWVIILIAAMIIPIFIIFLREVEIIQISALMAVLMIIAGFLFSAVAGYMAGLVGSSNNPISGVTIATILTASLILLALMGTGSGNGAAAAILIGAVVCCAAAIAGDNMQDLKAGHILGATPQKQQIMQMVGVVSAAVAIPFVLDLLNTAYGFGAPTEAHPNPLTAPQATLMQSVAEGVFKQNLPWNLVGIGIGIGVAIIILDQYLKGIGSSFRTPVLAVAVGLYLPFELDTAIMLGGIIAYWVNTYQKKQISLHGEQPGALQRSNRTGLLIASGLITGEALLGIFLAIPVAIYKQNDILALIDQPLGDWPGLLLLAIVCWYLYQTTVKRFHQS
jgi:putative OPT family oligopeptide transporter